MHLTHLLLLSTATMLAAQPAVAQLRANRPPPRTVNLPRLMVATPYPANSSDSVAAVRIGDGMRKQMDDIAGKWFNTLTRDQMNEALLQYAYPVDAVLPPTVARTLAAQLQARFFVSSTISRTEAGRYSAQVRAVGMNDKAGYAITGQQLANQSLEDFGKELARSLEPSFKALEEAKKCWDQQELKTRDAIEAARKSLREQPNHGLAEYCLAEIAKAQRQPVDTVMKHYLSATQGDPLSLDAWVNLAAQYEQRGDSTSTVRVFQEMLRVAPTNQALREQAFRLFLQYGQPQAAKEVAEEGLKIDPSNADLWDLKSNACLFLEDFTCAVDALEQVFEVDEAKADSAFYNKISVAATQQPDTARLLKWAQRGVTKYPGNVTMMEHLVTAYSFAGPTDSAVTTVHRLMEMGSRDLRPVLKAMQSLATEGRVSEVGALGDYVERLGNEDDKQNYALILVNGALPKLQSETPDFEGAATMARKAVSLSVPGGRMALNAHYVLGLATVLQVPPLDQPIMDGKSCELARKSQGLLQEAEAALNAGRAANPESVDRYLGIVEGYRPRVASQVKAFCT